MATLLILAAGIANGVVLGVYWMATPRERNPWLLFGVTVSVTCIVLGVFHHG